ncbi:MAG: EAL domain-containing protein [Gammaproteobacteria bacterium]|nr:EAL domain-containing protein [Gammaproteobacteria bacterium]
MKSEQLINKYLFVELLIYVAVAYFLLSEYWSAIAEGDQPYLIALFVGLVVWRIMTSLIVKSASTEEIAEESSIHWPTLSSGLFAGVAWGGLSIILYLLNIDGVGQDLRFALVNAGLAMIILPASGLLASSYLAYALPAFGLPLAFSIYIENIVMVPIWGLLLLLSLIISSALGEMGRMVERYQRASKENRDIYSKLSTSRDDALRMMRDLERANLAIQDEARERQNAEAKIVASEKELNRILQDMMDTYFRVDRGGRIIRISQSVRQLLGLSEDQLIGLPLSSIFSDDGQYKKVGDALSDHFGMVENLEVKLKHQQEMNVWVSINAHYFKDKNGEIDGFEGIARDITESRLAAEELYQEKERLRVTLGSIGDAVITTNTSCEVEYINPVGEEMTGWRVEDAHGKPLQEVLNLYEDDNVSRVQLPFKKWIKEGESAALPEPAMLVSRQKKSSVIELNGAPIFDSKNRVIGTVLVFHDVTKLRTLAMQLAYQATHDSLTGLVNRLEFDNLAEQALESAKNDGINNVLCFIDLDHFKAVNDTSGHQAGDELLKQVTDLMKSKLRKADTLGRLGGDEFGLLLNGCDVESGREIAQEICDAVDQYRLEWSGNSHRVGTSIGLVPIDQRAESLTEIFRAADSACYVAKEEGRNRVHVLSHDDEMVAEQHGKTQWLQRIQHALESDLFELHSQPITSIDGKGGEGKHIELLIRMIDKEDTSKLIPPGAFIPAAERYHLMPEIDRWVIRNAFMQLVDPDERGKNISSCAINLSGQSLSDDTLYPYIMAMFKQSGVSPRKICFEITESAVVSNIEMAKEFIQKLRKIGCRFALDDFGSGFSSFEYLKHLPVDYIKLDGSMINDIANNSTSLAMVKAINYISHVMGMKSIAEFVEDEETVAALKSVNINYAQGYFLGKPDLFGVKAE